MQVCNLVLLTQMVFILITLCVAFLWHTCENEMVSLRKKAASTVRTVAWFCIGYYYSKDGCKKASTKEAHPFVNYTPKTQEFKGKIFFLLNIFTMHFN